MGRCIKKDVVSHNVELYNADCIDVLKSLEANSVDLIATDPPYFKVKKDNWDNQWRDEVDFLAWLDSVLVEMYRVLKPSGSLYLFCSHKLAAKVEVLISQRFHVLTQIIWRKENGVHRRHCKEKLRSFASQTERIIFAEHYGSEGYAKGSSHYTNQCEDLKRHVFKPLISYFKDAKERLNIPSKLINEATGTQMCSHWFSYSQWKLPSEEQYKTLQHLFKTYGDGLESDYPSLEHDYRCLHKKYEVLRRGYDDLKQEYENLRRPFSVSSNVPYTDVWDYPSVQHYPNKHPCEKPLELMKHIIQTSSREGMKVLDPFLGSGTTALAAKQLHRHMVGVELDSDIYEQALKRIKNS